jgi:PAS domain S-box-containing protein
VLRQGVRQNGEPWGLVAIVLDTTKLLEEAGLSERMNGFELAVTEQDESQPFFGAGETFTNDAVTGTVSAFGEVWRIAVVPEDGFDAAIAPALAPAKWLSLLAVLLLGVIGYALSSRTESLLDAERRLLKSISDTSPVGIVVIDQDGRLTFANPYARELLGVEEVSARRFDDPTWQIADLDGHPMPSEELPFSRVMATGETVIDLRHQLISDDERKVVSVNAAPLPRGVVAIIQDVTQQVEFERRIRSALREKEVLLREIHHRVKNNLTIITSLLSLQQSRIRNADEAIAAFSESQSRVQSLAQLHQMLYLSENLEVIDLADYIREAARRIQNAYDPYGRVQLHLDLTSVNIDMDRAIPAGLVFTELFTNAMKHGAPPEGEGRVHIALELRDGRDVWLSVGNSGTTGPIDFNRRDQRTLGMEIVEALATQLRGELEVGTGDGTRVAIRFPLDGTQS